MVEIEGGTARERELLAAVASGMGRTRLECLRLREWADEGEGDERLTPDEVEDSRGTGVFLARPARPDVRTEWELLVVARAFAARAAEGGLGPVVWVGSSAGAESLRSAGTPRALTADDVTALRPAVTGAAAAAAAVVEGFEVLRPHGYAWALTLRVDEPHAFVRHRLRPLLDALHAWRHGANSYIEIGDGDPVAVWRGAHSGYGGTSAMRVDLECCNPIASFAVPIDAPPRPRCPVFG